MINLDKINYYKELLELGKSLTEFEEILFNLIKEYCKKKGNNCNIRVAGGWVRDKLIGKESDDIDLCIENCNMNELVELLSIKDDEEMKKPIFIKSNPEHSKFIETTRVRFINDKWIDICNLRGNNHQNNCGTPLSDAQNRDFTINSLFYNISTQKVEDFVNGINDLANNLIKTPIDPLITFEEDPLRIIRAFRFQIKLNFQLDLKILEISKLFQKHFEEKITRNRISIEFLKIFELNGFPFLLNQLVETNLFNSIFDPYHLWNLNSIDILNKIKIIENRNPNSLKYSLYLSTIYFNLYNLDLILDFTRSKKKISPIEFALTKILQPPHKTYEIVLTLLKGVNTFQNLNFNRVSIGKWIHDIGENWIYVGYLLFDELNYNLFYNKFLPFIENEGLFKIYEQKLLLNGQELADLFNIKPGPKIKNLLDNLLIWQIEHPNSNKEDYINFVKINNL